MGEVKGLILSRGKWRGIRCRVSGDRNFKLNFLRVASETLHSNFLLENLKGGFKI
ncbi:MAG: hypothetical protein V1889_03175 [archaeon]